jgi:hypothetical protein
VTVALWCCGAGREEREAVPQESLVNYSAGGRRAVAQLGSALDWGSISSPLARLGLVRVCPVQTGLSGRPAVASWGGFWSDLAVCS